MTSFEKTVKLACKPKAAPPKAKYLDPIIAATWSEDGAVHDVCKALSPRFREPNAIVVFKALIVLHTMIRNGSTDNVLQYLSSSDVLKLRNVSSGNWEGYQAPQNLQNYARYLDTRIRAYRELKHDAIRVQSETNRDIRNSVGIDEEVEQNNRRKGKTSQSQPSSILQRSKTMAGRKLRVMTVEKGLLRETKIVQKMVDSLVECRFYLDNLEDELNVTTLRMLVKDLLIVFQACNEGVINVLEHYFEMSKIDAADALAIYKHFCKQTERVVEYLGVAKKLQNLLNVPIPNLRHAPVSLASSLEEYLNDANFEQNRIEYKTQKEAAERNAKLGVKFTSKPAEKPSSPKPTEGNSSQSDASTNTNGKALIDFFESIDQPTMFNPQTGSPSTAYFQQQALHNPFQQQQPMMTGALLGAQAFGQAPPQQLQMQPTGFILPQQTATPFSTNPFGAMQGTQPPLPSFPTTQQSNLLVPQMTGANPFRTSTVMPQATGMPFGGQGFGSAMQSTNPFPIQNTSALQNSQTGSLFQSSPFAQTSPSAPAGQQTFPFNNPLSTAPTIAQPSAQPASNTTNVITAVPPRSATAPLTGVGKSASPPPIQSVKTHQTGSRNPFGQPVAAPPPPMPKPPTLMELAMGSQANVSPQQPVQTGTFPLFGSSVSSTQPNGSTNTSSPNANSSIMASVASSFAFGGDSKPSMGQSTSPLAAQTTSSTTTGSMFSDTLFSSLSSQPTGATSATSLSFTPTGGAALQRTATGFSGLKAFKPSSSFGAALLESLPPIPSVPTTPGSSSTTPGSSALGSQPTGFPGLASQPTGFGASSLGVGLRPQVTGGLAGANPFRASMFPTTNPTGGASTPSFLNSTSSPPLPATSAFGSGASQGSFGAGAFGGGYNGLPDPTKQSQQQQSLF